MKLNITDPRVARSPKYAPVIAALLNDPRDSELVGLLGQCLLLAALAVLLFFLPYGVWYAAPLYWLVLFAGLLDRFTLMLHCTSHRPLFKARAWLRYWARFLSFGIVDLMLYIADLMLYLVRHLPSLGRYCIAAIFWHS